MYSGDKCAVGAGGAARNLITISSCLPGMTLLDLGNSPPQWDFPCFCGTFPHSLRPSLRGLELRIPHPGEQQAESSMPRGGIRSRDTSQTHGVQFQCNGPPTTLQGKSPLLAHTPGCPPEIMAGTAEDWVCVQLHLLPPRTAQLGHVSQVVTGLPWLAEDDEQCVTPGDCATAASTSTCPSLCHPPLLAMAPGLGQQHPASSWDTPGGPEGVMGLYSSVHY